MVKHTQTIHRQQTTNCLSVSDHFVGLALKGLKLTLNTFSTKLSQISYFIFNLGHLISSWDGPFPGPSISI